MALDSASDKVIWKVYAFPESAKPVSIIPAPSIPPPLCGGDDGLRQHVPRTAPLAIATSILNPESINAMRTHRLTRFRPARLLAYKCWSALFMRDSRESPGSTIVPPTDTVTRISKPSMCSVD